MRLEENESDNFGASAVDRNYNKEYHVVDPKELTFPIHEDSERLKRLIGELTSRPLLEKDATYTYAGLKSELNLRSLGGKYVVSIGGLIDLATGEKAVRVCGGLGRSFDAALPDLEYSGAVRQFKDFLSALKKVEYKPNEKGSISNAISLEAKLSGEINTMPLSKFGEIGFKVETNKEIEIIKKLGISIADKITISAKGEVKLCITVKDEGPKYGNDLLPYEY
jgi:hypothetical protein